MAEEYIDIDKEKEIAGLKTESYEQIVLKQIREAAVALSKPRTGGQIIKKMVKGREEFVQVPDMRETVIRTVNTLRSLLMPFIKTKLEKEFKEINDEKEKIKKDLDEKLIKVNNVKGKTKEFNFIPPNHPIIKMRIERECDNAEKLFAILVKAFHQVRIELQEYETD